MFETKRLILRGFDEETDLQTIVKWQNNLDFRILGSNGPIAPVSNNETKNFFFQDRPIKDSLPILAVCEKPTDWPAPLSSEPNFYKACGLPIGVLNFQMKKFDYKNRIGGLGIAFPDQQHRGKGYGSEAMEWLLEYVFMDLGLHRLELEVYTLNQRALALYRKVGMKEEGRQRKTYFKSGQWYDTIIMAMLEEEWIEIRRKGDSSAYS